MKPSRLLGLVTTLTLALPVSSYAQSSSAKFSASLSSAFLVPATTAQDWKTVLSTSLKTPNQKDLLLGGSLEIGLFTSTTVSGKNGTFDTATANAQVEVQILVDSKPAFPGTVVYERRKQTLSAILGGVISQCQDIGAFTYNPATDTCTQLTDSNGVPLPPDGIITVPCECTVTDEEISLLLDTTAAHHFNFVAKNLPAGNHTIALQVRIGTIGTTPVDATATATVGKGSLTVEEVRATNSPDGITFLQ
jgi:hypothetical protein